MSWNPLGISIATYSTVTSTSFSWQQLSSISTAGGALVGFELKVDDQYPELVNNILPVYLLD